MLRLGSVHYLTIHHWYVTLPFDICPVLHHLTMDLRMQKLLTQNSELTTNGLRPKPRSQVTPRFYLAAVEKNPEFFSQL